MTTHANQPLSDRQRQLLASFLADGGELRAGLDIYLAYRVAEWESTVASNMRSHPRQPELASDYASKAEVYQELMKDLERFLLA